MSVPEGGDVPGILILRSRSGTTWKVTKKICERFTAEGFVALAPKIQFGSPRSSRFGSDAVGVIDGAAAYLRTLFAVSSDKIGVVGFSSCGGCAIRLASERSSKVVASVIFYGLREEGWVEGGGAFLGHFVEVDRMVPLESVRRLEMQLRSGGNDVTFHIYRKMRHGFFEEDRRASYNPRASSLAWRRSVQFLRRHLE